MASICVWVCVWDVCVCMCVCVCGGAYVCVECLCGHPRQHSTFFRTATHVSYMAVLCGLDYRAVDLLRS
jgi:hypothetical protein